MHQKLVYSILAGYACEIFPLKIWSTLKQKAYDLEFSELIAKNNKLFWGVFSQTQISSECCISKKIRGLFCCCLDFRNNSCPLCSTVGWDILKIICEIKWFTKLHVTWFGDFYMWLKTAFQVFLSETSFKMIYHDILDTEYFKVCKCWLSEKTAF